ncbi:methyltransferase domain-containing protein [Methanofollis aquaemaris]|uniref:Methyltransferase domain-containing protein n=1 Tax=Methanofollis aquaemaris TaxID=126734 RepID=A0A8A3S4K4_9EURY|nr:HemK2/MTQ2 family protein methyltransferase [Methanofollis aquaemaris]QSZ66544.1 methyltransferase domain-containing protein [Methanofollis aquaemaris]
MSLFSRSPDDQVYQPAEDTFLLRDAALDEVRPDDRVLEVGCGSGTVIAALRERAAAVVATDINPHAVGAGQSLGVETVRTDLFAGLKGPFDLVLFNPPYLPTLPEERIDDWLEYALDGGPTGRVTIERFAEEVGRVLAPYGRILLLISSLTGPDEVRQLFADLGYTVLLVAREEVEGEELLVLRISRDLCTCRA